MRRQHRFIVAWLLLFATMLGAVAQEKVLLQYRAQAGQTIRYRVSGTIGFDFAGNAAQAETTIVYTRRITEVSPEGNITWEEEYETYEVKIGGQTVPIPDEVRPGKSTTTIKPNGEIIKRESSRTEEMGSVGAVGTNASIIFSTEPVGVGDRWRHTFEENKELGIGAGEAEYTLKSFETWNGIRVARILVNFTARGEAKGSSESEMLVELRTGDVVYATIKGEASAARDGLSVKTTFDLTLERIEGSPLPEGVNGTPAAAPAQADSKPQQPAEQKAEKAEQPKPADGEKKDEKKDDAKKKEKTIEEVTKDFEKLEGLFTLYRKKES
ncbi:MAG: hypothetical protein RMK45_08290, partial [Armatimonadota bacterium]|nr:hypothetical protein [Armatimonadota bacterium]